MKSSWKSTLLFLSVFVALGESLPTGSMSKAEKSNQLPKSKTKRAQETLMFGNQQNSRQNENSRNSNVKSLIEKRTLSSSGLEDVKGILTEGEKLTHPKPPPASNSLYERDPYSQMEKNYEYGKILVNELGDELPTWDISRYSPYYTDEDRRKRSEKSASSSSSTTSGGRSTTSGPLPTSAFPTPTTTSTTQHPPQSQMKRSIPIYPEPRYKRELKNRWDSEDVLALLASLWEKERRTGNWRNYGNEEYDNMEDDNEIMDEDDSQNGIWLDNPVYLPHRYAGDSMAAPDIGIPRTHPTNYYDQFSSQYGQQQYDNPIQFGTTQYGNLYPQHTYYPSQEKRFMVSRKRAQDYDPYNGLTRFQFGAQPRIYPNYQHRMVY